MGHLQRCRCLFCARTAPGMLGLGLMDIGLMDISLHERTGGAVPILSSHLFPGYRPFSCDERINTIPPVLSSLTNGGRRNATGHTCRALLVGKVEREPQMGLLGPDGRKRRPLPSSPACPGILSVVLPVSPLSRQLSVNLSLYYCGFCLNLQVLLWILDIL